MQQVKLKFTRQRSAKVMGKLADRETDPNKGETVSGILVTQNFSSKIVSAEDLPTYTQLRVGSVSSKLHVPFAGQVGTLRLFLNEMFADVTEEKLEGISEGVPVVQFGLHENQVTVTMGLQRGIATVEWTASPVGDILADSVVALLMHAQSSTASIRLTSQPCSHTREPENGETCGEGSEPANKKARGDDNKRVDSLLRLFHDTLLNQFKDVDASYDLRKASFEIRTDVGLESGTLKDGEYLLCVVEIDFGYEGSTEAKITVECSDSKVAKNVQECLKNVAEAAAPLSVSST
jgi:hypothetical protein